MNITQSIVSERDRALLGGDYANYHVQATRRVHILRKRLGTATPRGRKYTPKSPVTAEQIAKNSQWVQLLLTSSERAWANALAMKSSQSPENTQKPMAGSTKKQIASRHRRAIAYASNLVEVLSDQASRATSTDLLEAKAYLALLRGGLNFEKSRWTSCIQHYAVARLIYVALDQSTKIDVFKDLLTNTVDPSIKYAAYQSKLPRTKAVSDIAIENFPSSEQSTKKEVQDLDPHAFETTTEKAADEFSDAPSNLPTSITWRSRKVKIEDASVSQAIGISLDKEQALADVFLSYRKHNVGPKELAAAYEDVIDARQETVDVTKTAVDELRSQGVDQGDNRIQSLQITRTAVNYAVIEWRIGRNRTLCGSDDGLAFEPEIQKQNPKPRKDGKPRQNKEESSGRKLARLRERVALYDSILQSLESIKELPGIAADTELTREVDGKKTYFRALKCLAVGRAHVVNGSIANSLALFVRAHDFVKQLGPSSVSETSQDQPAKLEISPAQLQAVQTHIASLSLQYRALSNLRSLETSQTGSVHVSKPPLIERFHLKQYDAELDPKNLVNYPPKLQPIPVKPLFFDLAWNYVHYPGQKQLSIAESVIEKVQEAVTDKKEDKPARKGWFGFGR